ncbi:MAG: bifunctional diaminohydroxyphosphoribosylaminopyrimidine deaminase/5-amino-6-(5-phosphoribosylamino)uracil reductase RibD [Paludibacteraceae bacterium]|nr:bifunctional diaminohydroxyphosphoribosylaminopyrimidine deaminase/5-amino-6-(5-phosphoribosylamino)uracil reductase RibD [Paludibacteraceae bacterium]
MTTDEKYMQRCLALAQRGEYYVAPNPMVGAVLVSAEGNVLAEGWHEKYGGPHAEVNCFRAAEANGVSEKVMHDATLYVSLEPCSHYGKTPPCADLVVNKGLKRVVCGMRDPNPLVAGQGIEKLRKAGMEVTVGVEETACRELNKRFLMLQEQHRPYIILKWAQTADGFIDTIRMPSAQPQEPLQISTDITKRLVHKMRAENMSIMVGSGTVLLDDPHLTTKHWEGRNPVRIVLDRRARVPMSARVMQEAEQPSDYLLSLPRTILWREQSDWQTLFAELGRRGIHSVLVEGGAHILNSLLEAQMYDELHVEVNPRLTIGEGVHAPMIDFAKMHGEEVDGNILYSVKRIF